MVDANPRAVFVGGSLLAMKPVRSTLLLREVSNREQAPSHSPHLLCDSAESGLRNIAYRDQTGHA